jgi:hypothetical protein
LLPQHENVTPTPPPTSTWKYQAAGVVVLYLHVFRVDRDVPFLSLVVLSLGSSKTERLPMTGQVETGSLPLHDVVAADDPRIPKAADAIQIAASMSPASFRLAGHTREPAVVVSARAHQVAAGSIEIAGAPQPEFAAEAILKNAQQSFDTPHNL